MRAGRSVFWLPDQSIRRAFPALFLLARLPSRRRAFEKSCRGIGRSLATAGQWPISTVVPGYSDGLASDLHRLPSTPEAHSHFPLSSPAPHRRSGSPSTVMSRCLCTAPTARPSSGAGRTRRQVREAHYHCPSASDPIALPHHQVLGATPRRSFHGRRGKCGAWGFLPNCVRQAKETLEFHRGRAAVKGRRPVTKPLRPCNEDRGKATGCQ